jgi:hypothetical protein
MFCLPILAGAEPPAAKPPAAEPGKEAGDTNEVAITVSGKVAVTMATDKAGEVCYKFFLKTEKGPVMLPDTTVVDFDDLVNKEVVVVGKGKKTGNRIELTTVEKVTPAGTAVPKDAPKEPPAK